MGVGLTGSASVPQDFARVELSPGSPSFSPGQIVNGRVAQLGPKGAVIEIADRLATVVTDLDLAVGELVQLSVKEVARNQTLLQLVGRDGVLLSAQMAAEPQLARLIASYRLPVDRPHINAVRRLLARGLPITRENLEKLVRALHPRQSSQEMEGTDSVLAKLIESYDLPIDEPHLNAARQLLARGLPVAKENVEQLTRALSRFGATTEADFQAATYLQANNLPLTRSSLAVVRSSLENPVPMGQQFHQLQQTLVWVAELLETLTAERGLPQREIHRLVKQAVQQLSQRIVQAGGEDRAALVESLRRVFKDQGTSLENHIARVLSGSTDPVELEGDLRYLLGRLAEVVSEEVSPARGWAGTNPLPGEHPKGTAADRSAGTVGEGSTAPTAPDSDAATVQGAADGEKAAGGAPLQTTTEGTREPKDGATPQSTTEGVEPEDPQNPSKAGSNVAAARADEEPPVSREKMKGQLGSAVTAAEPADPHSQVSRRLSDSPDLQRALVYLRQAGPELAEALQLQQLKNSAQPRDPLEQWLAFQVPISGQPGEAPRTVELRVSRRPNRKVDPERARLLMRLDLPRLDRVEVRLELSGKQIDCRLASSSDGSLPVLREQFDSLRQGLERLGYQVGTPRFGTLVDLPDPTEVEVEVPERLAQIDVRA